MHNPPHVNTPLENDASYFNSNIFDEISQSITRLCFYQSFLQYMIFSFDLHYSAARLTCFFFFSGL